MIIYICKKWTQSAVQDLAVLLSGEPLDVRAVVLVRAPLQPRLDLSEDVLDVTADVLEVACRQRRFSLNSSYVCPEPVLAKCSFQCINGSKKGAFCTPWTIASPYSCAV